MSQLLGFAEGGVWVANRFKSSDVVFFLYDGARAGAN